MAEQLQKIQMAGGDEYIIAPDWKDIQHKPQGSYGSNTSVNIDTWFKNICHLRDSSSDTKKTSLIVGNSACTSNSAGTFICGYNNQIANKENPSTKNDSSYSFIGGQSNVIHNSSMSFAYGQGINISNHSNQIVFGKYNKDTNALFVISDGKSSSAPHNAFEIYPTSIKINNTILSEDAIKTLLSTPGRIETDIGQEPDYSFTYTNAKFIIITTRGLLDTEDEKKINTITIDIGLLPEGTTYHSGLISIQHEKSERAIFINRIGDEVIIAGIKTVC